ncbi:MAG: HEAT repeat domain-containing protein, partial [Okeania sp. SIO2D1]|nr:HEAT repeat domain-containing protein [Okeania sp. SIO2D1]
PKTLPLLKNRAKKDPDENVRSEAIKRIANGWKDDPGIFNFLGNCALNDPFKNKDDSYPFPNNPRKTVLEAITKKYPNHSQTLPLLKNRAKKDPDKDVRNWAKKTLQQFQKWKGSN